MQARAQGTRLNRSTRAPERTSVCFGGSLGEDLVEIDGHAVAEQLPRDRRAPPLEQIAWQSSPGTIDQFKLQRKSATRLAIDAIHRQMKKIE